MTDNKYELKDAGISLYYNEDAGEKKPIYTGDIKLPNGEVHRVALWPWEAQSGKRGLSGLYEPHRPQDSQPQTSMAEAVAVAETASADLPW
jgi:hypothetical protein